MIVLWGVLSIMSWAIPAYGQGTSDVLAYAWKPMVELTGGGDTAQAIDAMQELTELHGIVLKNTQNHPETQAFIDDMWRSLERFNLKTFYKMLPQQQDEWRQLQIFGRRDGGVYRIGPDTRTNPDAEPMPEARLGDFAMLARVDEILHEDGDRYLINYQWQAGVNPFSVAAIDRSISAALGLLEIDGSQFGGQSSVPWIQKLRSDVKTVNPKLEGEDVTVLTPLWAGFPASWLQLSKWGQIDNVINASEPGTDYQHMMISFTILPEKMARYYPHLAGYLTKLGELIGIAMDVDSEDGRVLRMMWNSETLKGTLEGYVRNGELLPVKDNKPILIDRVAQAEQQLTVKAHILMRVFGLEISMNNLISNVLYRKNTKEIELFASTTQMPDINIEGRFFGIMPASMIDSLMPSGIDGLAKEFMKVAVEGDNGKGIHQHVRLLQEKPKQLSNLKIESTFEGLNNFMVRLGVSIISKRVIPGDDATNDIRRLMLDSNKAFASDLVRFEKAMSL